MVDARKERFGSGELEPIFKGARRVLACKGKKVQEFDMRSVAVTDEAFEVSVLGPSGNLRAPTLRAGSTVVVGFHAEVYADLFG
jgi:hypothetical protein